MLDDPARVDAHVVGHHVAGQPDAVAPRPVAQVGVGRLAAEVLGDRVVVERVGRGDGVGLAAHPLDPLGRLRALPQADQPQPGHAPAGQRVELLVRDPVERPDVAPVRPRQLVEPDIRALGDQHDPRHPGRVGRERLGLVGRGPERRRLGAVGVDPARIRTAAPAATEPQVERALLLGQDADGDVDPPDQVVEALPERHAPVERGRTGAGRPATSAPGGPAGGSARAARSPRRRRAGRRRTSSRGGRSRRGSGCPRRATRSSTSSWSGPIAGFSLATRVSSSSSSRSSGGSGSGPAPGNSSPNRSSRRPASGPSRASRSARAAAIAPGWTSAS